MDAEVAKAIKQLNSPRGKWKNVRTPCNHGHVHDSKKEANRCNDLHMAQRAEIIKGLKVQVSYELWVNGLKVCGYRSDFEYWELYRGEWIYVVEDTKGKRTVDYMIKRKLMKAVHGITIRET